VTAIRPFVVVLVVVMLRVDFSFVSWNTLLLRLANIQLQLDYDQFCWNLHESKFSIASMYNTLIQFKLPIDKNSNNRLWKLKLSLRIKVFGWYLRKGVIFTKIILQNETGMEVEHVFSVIRMKQLNTYSSNIVSYGLYGQSSK
jgi:hypothetical protein